MTKAKVEEALGKIDGVVGAEMEATGVPGVAVAVVYRDTTVFANGYGLRRLGSPEKVGVNTVFQIASMSKPVSSTAVAALVGKRKFGWDDPVRTYLPDLAFSDPYVTDQVTFADLYSHRSGLPGDTGNRLEEIGFSRDQILQRFRYVPLNPFRATYSYSNFGMTAAGQAAAAADKTTFEDMMQQQLFGPAGMTSTSARHSDFVSRPDRASLHIRLDGKWQLGPERDPDAQAPAGGISSSVTDLAKWMRLQLSGGTLDGEPIVAKDALTETHTPHIVRAPLSAPDAPAATYGLGWNINVDHLGYVRWAHSGAFSVGAATTTMLLPKASLGVVVLTNGAPIGAAEAMADNIVDDVVNGTPTRNWGKFWGDLFAQLFVPDPELAKPPANATPAGPTSAYVGAYSNPYYGTFDVRADTQGQLTITVGPKRLVFPMTHWNASTFTYVESPETPDFRAALTFTLGSDGQAATLDVGGMPGVNILRRTG
jgi:CubicO group peptidase (beta-lactamase class C family)